MTIADVKAACLRAIELSDKASAGPWTRSNAVDVRSRRDIVARCSGTSLCEQSNAAHIAHARAFSPAAAKALLAVIDGIHANGPHGLIYSPTCHCYGCKTIEGILAAFTEVQG